MKDLIPLLALLAPLIGALILARALFWRCYARRVCGTVVTVDEFPDSDGDKLYAATYEYPGEAGQSIRATSPFRSGSLQGKLPGSSADLMVFPEDPALVREAGAYFLEFFGILFIGGGIGIVHTVRPDWPIVGMVLPTLGLFAGAMVWSVRTRRARQEKEHPAPAVGSVRTAAPGPGGASAATALQGNTLDAQEAMRRVAKERRGGFLPIAMGLLFLAAGLFAGWRIVRLEIAGVSTTGTVVQNLAMAGGDSSSYQPLVRFVADNGRTIQFVDWAGSSHPSYRDNAQVKVLYLPEAPEASAMIDKGISNWILSLIFSGLGAAIIVSIVRRKIGRPAQDIPR